MKKEPLVVCLTNSVAANFTANVLLAIGAKPAMMACPPEAEQLTALADALLINLGTVDPPQAEAMKAAIDAACAGSVPWVMDPVACHILDYRRALFNEFLEQSPAIVRGNHDEIDYLLKHSKIIEKSAAVLSTGETDYLYSQSAEPSLTISGGVAMLQRVTATGCAQGAVCAAFLGWGQTPLVAAQSASELMKKAGERAWTLATSPGGFQAALLDALYELAPRFLGAGCDFL